MGRNYYCDYCDKRLKNDAQVIKKHIAGLAHTAARNDHFAKYKGMDPIKFKCKKLKQFSF